MQENSKITCGHLFIVRNCVCSLVVSLITADRGGGEGI